MGNIAQGLKEIRLADQIVIKMAQTSLSHREDLAYDAIDKYKQAANMCKEHDLEITCIAYTKMAKLYVEQFSENSSTEDCQYRKSVVSESRTKAKYYMEEMKVFSRQLS